MGELQKSSSVYVSTWYTIISVILVVGFILDVFLELKVIDCFGMEITSGAFLYPLVYIADDCISEIYGYKKAIQTMWITIIASIAVVCITQLVCLMPAVSYWEYETAFNTVFSVGPRYFIAGIASLVVGSVLNSFVLTKMKLASNGKFFKMRAIISSMIARIFEIATFFFGAYLGTYELTSILFIIMNTWIMGIACELLVVPLTEKITTYIKNREGIDVMDKNTNYNPLLVFKR